MTLEQVGFIANSLLYFLKFIANSCKFMSMKQEAPHESRSGSPDQYKPSGGSSTSKTDEQEGRTTPSIRRTRSMSLNKPYFGENDGAERMKHTKAFRKNGFKGNSRGFNIQAPFATLEETFKALEPQVGFNIELSMYSISGFIHAN